MIEVLIALAPLLALLVALGLGHYPGERLVLRAIRALDRRRPVAGPAGRAPVVQVLNWLPRGGDLLAFSIAGRAPPA